MKTYMKVDMAVKSLTSTFTDNKDIAQEMGQSMEDSADQTEESSERMGVAATLLAGPVYVAWWCSQRGWWFL